MTSPGHRKGRGGDHEIRRPPGGLEEKMAISLFGKRGSFAYDPTRRGYHVAYREDEVNHCPGCGRSHWYVGRLSAECGFCGTALPLIDSLTTGAGLFVSRGGRPIDDLAVAA